jgi:hypothetical protein
MFCHLIHLLTQAEKQGIKREQEEEEDRQEELLRLAADQEAKVSNAVVNSIYMICNSLTSKLAHYVLPIA